MRIISRVRRRNFLFFPQHDYKTFLLLPNAFQNHCAGKNLSTSSVEKEGTEVINGSDEIRKFIFSQPQREYVKSFNSLKVSQFLSVFIKKTHEKFPYGKYGFFFPLII